MNISWDDARLFLAIAESGSFTRAAKLLALGQPTLSRRIAQLEFQLGFALFHRGKRGTRLSPEGERLLPTVQQMARWAAEFERTVAGREQIPSGRVRLAAAPGFAVDFLVPFCAQLRRDYPELELEILASIAHLDLTRGDADLAVRTRVPNEPELVGLYRIEVPLGVFASREYTATLPPQPSPADIGWVTWCHPYEHLSPRPELAALIPNFRPAFASDDYVVQKRACDLGLGAMILPRTRHPLVADTGLVEIPFPIPLPKGEMHVVCAKSMEHVPRIRTAANALIRELERLEIV